MNRVESLARRICRLVVPEGQHFCEIESALVSAGRRWEIRDAVKWATDQRLLERTHKDRESPIFGDNGEEIGTQGANEEYLLPTERTKAWLFSDRPVGEDDDAWVPISTVWRDKFETYKQCKAFLNSTNQIRTRKPNKQRLDVHAGDWVRFWRRQSDEAFEELDSPSEQVEALISSAEERKADVYRRNVRWK